MARTPEGRTRIAGTLTLPEFGDALAGLVMVRGRIGGGGAPFNAGEATVARCTVKLASGEVGFGHVMGRDEMRAKAIALLDALAQTAAHVPPTLPPGGK